MEPIPRCQVCFIISFPAEERRRMIKCIKCSQFAHFYCYLPSCKNTFFTCDACQKGTKEEKCFICEQYGLLKRAGDRFAHPICMLFNPSFLVKNFKDFSFIQIEPLRPRVKQQCVQCSVTSGYVMNCGLKCPSACHVYCAFKSNEHAESQGGCWRACFGLSHGSSTFSELFETMILKGLSYQHKALKSLLSPGKQSKKVVATQIQLYCRDHSATLIQCRCNEIDSQKDRWIYCDCCCRWQHTECLENQKEAEEAINDESQKFYCLQCKIWSKMTLETNLEIPKNLPKLQIYDYVFIQLYLQTNQFQVSHTLHEFVFKLPIFPGKEYVEHVYRKQIASILSDKISLESKIKSLCNSNGHGNEGGMTEGLIKIFDQSREKLLMTWILCKEDLFQSSQARITEFSKRLGRQLNKESNLRIVVDLLIDFDDKFKNGNFREIRQIVSWLDGNVQGSKVLSNRGQRQNESKQKTYKGVKIEKPLLALNDKLRKLTEMAKENNSKQTVFQILSQIHALINSPQIMSFHNDLPKVPIVFASILLKDKESAIKYVVVMTHLQYLRGEWERLIGNNKCQDRQAFIDKRRILLADAEKYYDLHIIEEENDKLKEELMKEWARNEVSMLIPSRELSLTEPAQIIANINFHNLNLRKVNETLQKYTQEFLANSERKEGFSYIKELTIMQKFLTKIETLRFTKKSYLKMKELANQNWNGEYMNFIPKILKDFIRLFDATDRLLKEEMYRNIKEQICLFDQWKEAEQQALFDDEIVERYLIYFKEIEGVKIHRFNKEIYGTIRGKFIMMVDKIEEKSQFFRNEMEYKLISRWCTAMKIVPKRMGEIFKKDRDFQQSFLFLKPQFDNIQATQKLDALVSEHFHYCKSKQIQFRVHQLQVLLTWIDLHKAILSKVSVHLLLNEQQAQCFDSQVKGKPDYYVLREIYNIMRQTKFPNCLFFTRFQKIVEEGEAYYKSINKVFECCNWGYDLSASLDWQKKIEKEEFESTRKKIKQCNFYFEAESIELDIIKEKFDEAERQAQMLKLQSQKRAERDYLQGKARNLLVSFGCFPIISKWTKLLWELLENQKIAGLPENLQAYIADLQKSRRMHSWQELENLRELIDSKFQGKYQKKNYCNKLSILTAKNRELYEKSKLYLQKYNQTSLFSQTEMENIKVIVSEYQEMQFEDEEIVFLQLKHEHYLAVKAQMKWRQKFKISDIKKLQFLEHTVTTLHASFVTPEVETYLLYIREQLRKSEEEQQLEQESKANYYNYNNNNYINNAARKSNGFLPRNSNSPRHIAEPANTNRRDKRYNDRNSPVKAAKSKSNQRKECRY